MQISLLSLKYHYYIIAEWMFI